MEKEIIFDDNQLEELAFNSVVIRDVKIEKNFNITIIVGTNGIFTIINFTSNKHINVDYLSIKIQLIRKKLLLPVKGTYFFIKSKNAFLMMEKSEKSLFMIDDFKEAFNNLYINTTRPFTDLLLLNINTYQDMIKEPTLIENDDMEVEDTGDPTYVQLTISEKKVTALIELAVSLQIHGRNIRYENGYDYKLHPEVNLFGIGEKKWFRISSEDPDDIYKVTLIGGWFGLHRFYERDYFNGIIYLFTCGIFGVGYISDLLMTILGARSYKAVEYNDNGKRVKKKIYYNSVKNKLFAWGGILISLIIVFILINTVYQWIYSTIITLLINMNLEYLT